MAHRYNVVIEDKENDLLERIRHLKDYVPRSERDVKEKVKRIEQKAKEVIKLNKNERQWKDKEIEKLKKRVSRLEQEVAELRKEAVSAGTIDAGEAMKIMEYHVAMFVLQGEEEIGDNAIQDMLERLKRKEYKTAKEEWDVLTQMCKMTKSWTPDHSSVQKILLRYRNAEAHHKKFDFERLKKMMFKKRPYHKEECEDIIRMFTKVDNLMKFGIIASDFMKIEAKQGKCSNSSRELLKRSAKRWARENVLYLQDIKLTEAKEHVAQYLPHVDDFIWSCTISTIFDTNRPRFGKLVKQKEAELLGEVVKIFAENAECETLEELIKFSRSAEWKENRRDEGQRWHNATKYIWWTASHNNAMKAMKYLLPDDQREYVDPLPLHVAKLHVADFVENDLWEASSEILEIFEWDKESDSEIV